MLSVAGFECCRFRTVDNWGYAVLESFFRSEMRGVCFAAKIVELDR